MRPEIMSLRHRFRKGALSASILGMFLAAVPFPASASPADNTAMDDLLAEALAAFRNNDLSAPRAMPAELLMLSHIMEGIAAAERDDAGTAERLARSALEQAGNIADLRRRDMIDVMELLATQLDQANRLSAAEALMKEAVNFRIKTWGNSHPATLESMETYGAMLLSLNKLDELETLLKRVLDIRQATFGEEDPDTLTSRERYAGLIGSLGRTSEVAADYRRILDIRKRVLGERHQDTLRSLRNYAAAISSLGRKAEAEPFIRQAMELSADLLGESHPDTFLSIHNYAVSLNELGHPEQADALAKRALDLGIKLFGEESYQTLTSFLTAATVADELGHREEAENLMERAFVSSRKLGDDHWEIKLAACNNYAHVLIRNGRLEKARAILEEALETGKGVPGESHPIMLKSLGNYATILGKSGNIVEAERLDRRVVELSRARLGDNHIDTLKAALNHIADLLRLGRTDEAVEWLSWGGDRLYGWSGMEMQAMPRDVWRREMLFRISTWTDVIVSVALQAPTARRVDLAAQTVLRWKHRATEDDALLERLMHRPSDPGVGELASRVADIRRQLLAHIHNQREDLYRQASTELDETTRRLRQSSPEYATDALSRNVTVDQVVAALPERSVLVEFRLFDSMDPETGALSPTRLAAAVLQKEQAVALYDAGPVADIQARLDRLAKGNIAEAASLYEVLFGPVLERLRSADLVFVVPDGPLWSLSLATLQVEAGDGGYRPWVEMPQRIHVLATGRDLLTTPARPPAHEATGVVIFGGVDFDGVPDAGGRSPVSPPTAALARQEPPVKPLGALPESRVEVEQIRAAYATHGDTVVTYTDRQATEARLKALPSPPRVLHLASHGVFRTMGPVQERPELMSWVALSGANRGREGQLDADHEDGLLTALEIASLSLEGTALVVLSACETGQGEVDYSEGLIGLTRALRIAGAGHVLAALRSVPDDMTAEFMTEFHRAWIRLGMGNPQDALKAVQIAYSNDPDKRRSEPGFWGAFIMLGP
jgi:tetratricopeptide (TPR) repeat protein